jgi:hypothetical protein
MQAPLQRFSVRRQQSLPLITAAPHLNLFQTMPQPTNGGKPRHDRRAHVTRSPPEHTNTVSHGHSVSSRPVIEGATEGSTV